MSLSLYDVSVPAFIRGFANLSEILKKAEAFADEKGIPHSQLLEACLIEDMLPLTGQIQRASDTAKFVPVRVGQLENVAMEDNEVTFADLHARIDKTVAFLKTVVPASMSGRDEAEVVLKTRSGEMKFTATDYVLGFALPNFYFHLTAAYAILRHKGVPIGKTDYLGRS
ncbi:hypothetical protein ASG19_06150 [Rhizobium sp. Leaf306]|jgi:hypothetical protein|uniref:DUF1993 domain-containing protein n=1 Tax=Rhizobium/Agrobacterium group TaxID=227290 RepID=UPI000715235C|nr:MULTISPECIES: DUF1993 domain-containing protein [unclassified Rhizobium]KQQ38612.1 hypothetical protein ASG19_06150 [Rhizobium sp. Leaf306]KQQ73299.1 hypothetical protein ASF70_05530 [Rhizobium sp. Leaf321]MBD8665182.1 DUF1993 domain-containing protein [Rhizobium sp. CFBP 8752]